MVQSFRQKFVRYGQNLSFKHSRNQLMLWQFEKTTVLMLFQRPLWPLWLPLLSPPATSWRPQSNSPGQSGCKSPLFLFPMSSNWHLSEAVFSSSLMSSCAHRVGGYQSPVDLLTNDIFILPYTGTHCVSNCFVCVSTTNGTYMDVNVLCVATCHNHEVIVDYVVTTQLWRTRPAKIPNNNLIIH